MNNKLQDALEEQKQGTEPYVSPIPGILGIPMNGQKRVEVLGRNSYVYVRLRSNQSEVIQAYNNQVATAYNLPVLVKRQGNKYVVIGVDSEKYENNWSSQAAFIPRHGNSHSFDIESGGGGDVVWVYPRQFTPILVVPSGSSGAGNVIVNPYTLKNDNGTWKYIGGTGTPNITQYNPSSPTGAVMALVYLDSNTGNPQIIVNSGIVFSNSITGSSQIPQYIPTITNPSQIPLAAIRLITGTSKISWDNIYDVRQFLHPISTGSGGGISSIPVQDEGVSQGNATTLNFTGAGVQATISGSIATVDVSGGGGINTGTLDARYLKLDASNDPLTDRLDITVKNGQEGLFIQQMIQPGTGSSLNSIIINRSPDLGSTGTYSGYGLRMNDGNPAEFTGGFLLHKSKDNTTRVDINPYATAGGNLVLFSSYGPISAAGRLLSLKNQGSEKFSVDGTGTVNISAGSTYNIGGTPHTHAGTGLTNLNISPTTANITATLNARHFADVSGLTASRNFIIPAGLTGDIIELNIKTGDDTYALVIIGDTGITINGGSAATEWSRLFISGESVFLVADTTSNWQVTRDGRIPCSAKMDRITTAITTNTAGAKTTVDWNNTPIDNASIADLTNNRFNIRRAGEYRVSFAYRPANGVTDQKYISVIQYGGASGATEFGYAVNRASAPGSAAINCSIYDNPVMCAVADQIIAQFATEEANIGMQRNDAGDQSTGCSWFAIKEVL